MLAAFLEQNYIIDEILPKILQNPTKKIPDICGSCPPIWMKNTAEMKDICSNHESVSAFFSMTMDRRDAQNVVDSSDVKECTRTIVCSEPHMLVK